MAKKRGQSLPLHSKIACDTLVRTQTAILLYWLRTFWRPNGPPRRRTTRPRLSPRFKRLRFVPPSKNRQTWFTSFHGEGNCNAGKESCTRCRFIRSECPKSRGMRLRMPKQAPGKQIYRKAVSQIRGDEGQSPCFVAIST